MPTRRGFGILAQSAGQGKPAILQSHLMTCTAAVSQFDNDTRHQAAAGVLYQTVNLTDSIKAELQDRRTLSTQPEPSALRTFLRIQRPSEPPGF